MLNAQVPQQVGIDFVTLPGLTGPWLGIDRPQPHLLHQALDSFAIDPMLTVLEFHAQAPTPVERPLQIEFI